MVDPTLPRKEQLSRKLEPLDWRTTQRENRYSYEQRDTPGKWARILTAIVEYQNRHAGQSPSDQTIASRTGLTLRAVQYHIGEMAKNGFITDVRGYPRVMIVHEAKRAGLIPPRPAGKEIVVEEAQVVGQTEDEKMPKHLNKKKGFYDRAKEIGQAIVDYMDRHGERPGVREVSEAVYGRRTGASAMVKKMVERGWVFHEPKHQRDLCLTSLGRAVLFGEMREPVHTDVPVMPTPIFSRPQPAVTQPAPTAVTRQRFYEEAEEQEERKPARKKPDQESDIDLILALTNRGYKVSR